MARDERQVGAEGLGWTMRASAAELMPMTALAADPNQKIMDLITSWALRAGRQYAIEAWLPQYNMRGWVQGFTTLLTTAIRDHLDARVEAGALDCNPTRDTNKIIHALLQMTSCADDTGPEMIDLARAALDLLFPETPGETDDDKPMPGQGCASDQSGEAEQSEERAEEGEQGDEGDEPESGESGDEQESGEQGDESSEDDDSEQGEGEPSSGESEDEGEPEPDGGEDEHTEEDTGDATSSTDTTSDLAKALADMEDMADDQTEQQVEAESDAAEDAAANGAGTGAGSGDGSGWRQPTKDEREIQSGAERFIRNLIDASESSIVTLTDTPSSSVDGAAMAAWKAGGQRRDPRFFIRTPVRR
jgi:hypothetical protein